MEIRLFRGNRVPLSPRELPVALALARVTRRSQFATAKLALSAPIGRDSRLAPRYAENQISQDRAPGGRKGAWTQRRGAGSWSPRSSASRRVTARPCASSMPRPRRSFSASASVSWVTEARPKTCCRMSISPCGGRPRASTRAWRARSPGSRRSRGTAPSTVCAPAAWSAPALPIEAADDVADASLSALERLEISDEQARLSDCLRELETRQAAAIRSAFLDGLTYDELARQARVPLGTMKSWIRRGLMKLKVCLER